MLNEKGIITIAIKHPYYGKMAHNLCGSFKAENPGVPFAVIADEKALSHLATWQKDIFDVIIPYEYSIENPFAAKFKLFELSPFQGTVFVDADTAWLPGTKFEDLLKLISPDCDYTGITEGHYNVHENNLNKGYPEWADSAHVLETFMIDGFYQWRSEFIYFKKCDEVKMMFTLLNDPEFNEQIKKLKAVVDFAGTIADELYFNIACAVSSIVPHKYKWTPIYWSKMHKNKVNPIRQMISSGFYLLSCGSNYVSGGEKRFYGGICSNAFKKIGRQHVFELTSKSEILTERKKY